VKLYFSIFESYEAVIEKRVERKWQFAEVKEREKIIEDYRKRYQDISANLASISGKYETL